MTQHQFEAVLKRPEGVGTWTYFDVPFSMVEVFGAKGQIKVKGTINGCAYRSSAMPHGDGTHYVVVKKEIREAIGATQGVVVQVTMELDTESRVVEVPADLQRALEKNRQARTRFSSLSYSHQKEFVDWTKGAKKSETRSRRIGQALEKLVEGTTPKSR